jgi:hypothetical protein
MIEENQMSDDPMNYTNPLGGHEVVADVLAQIKKRLVTDCNLRATDGYSGGYSGTITINLKLHAVRISPVEMEIAIKEPTGLPSVTSFPSENVFPVEVHEEISIPLEPNLKEVRVRTVENNSESVEEPESEPVEGSDAPVRRKRRSYSRALAGVGAVSE